MTRMLLQISCWIQRWKNFENRSTYAKVMHECKATCFFRLTVYTYLQDTVAEGAMLTLSKHLQSENQRNENEPSELKTSISLMLWYCSRICSVFSHGRPLLAAKCRNCSRFEGIWWPGSVTICALMSEPNRSSRSTSMGLLLSTAKHKGVYTRHIHTCISNIRVVGLLQCAQWLEIIVK